MINKVILVGNLGQDPELRYTQSGTAVATLSVATNRVWKDRDGNKQDETEWHRVIVWAQTAEFCSNYLSKGNKVYVEGRLQTRKWQDQNGNDRYTTEIVANELKSLTPRAGEGGGGGFSGEPPMPDESSMGPDPMAGGGGTGDDVPF
ncbi:MAG: single-stranded DNA-binding protein [Thermodesulfobacteriota bacterium]